MSAQYRFTFSEEFLITANLRYRRQISWRAPFYGVKWFLAIIFLALGVFLAVIAKFFLLIPFAVIAGSLFLGWPIDAWLLRRRFRKSPFHNDEISLSISEEGLHGAGRASETRLGWSVFSKARRFRDGLLLFQGSGAFHWLPDAAAVDSSSLTEAERLVRLHVRDFRDV
jgi:hypothetical protein